MSWNANRTSRVTTSVSFDAGIRRFDEAEAVAARMLYEQFPTHATEQFNMPQVWWSRDACKVLAQQLYFCEYDELPKPDQVLIADASKNLHKLRVFHKAQHGKHFGAGLKYFLTPGEEYERMGQFLEENPRWGASAFALEGSVAMFIQTQLAGLFDETDQVVLSKKLTMSQMIMVLEGWQKAALPELEDTVLVLRKRRVKRKGSVTYEGPQYEGAGESEKKEVWDEE